MSKLLPRLIAVLFSVACCSPSWAQLSIDASCDTTTVQCLADLDAITCDAPDLLGSEGEVIGTASCLLVSERDSFREICTASTANPISGSNAGALVMYNIQMYGVNSQYYEPTGAGLELQRFESGQAILSGTVQGVEDPTELWNVYLVYEGMTSDDAHVANGGGLKYDAGCAPVDPSTVDWDIYYMNGDMSYLEGAGSLDNSLLSLNHAPSNQYFGFQVGDGANDRNCNYGAGGWFSWEGSIKGEPAVGAMGDVLVDLSDCTQNDYDPCAASVTCYCVGVDTETNEFAVCASTTMRLDDTPPTWSNPPADVTIQCTDAIPAVATFTAIDNCEPADQEVITASFSGEVTLNPDELNGCYTIERTWTAQDACGNDTAYTQVITVEDTLAPVWDSYTPYVMEDCLVILTQEEAEDPSLVSITASDNCDPSLDYSIEAHEISGGCPTTWLRKWTATDDCGNESATVEQYVQLYDDTPPAIDAPADITLYVDGDCGYDADPEVTGLPTYSDHCTDQDLLDANLTFSDDTIDGACVGAKTITRTWSTTDFCLNENSDTQVITILDSIPPTGSIDDHVVDCAAYSGDDEYGTPTMDDNCSDVTYTWTTVTDRLNACSNIEIDVNLVNVNGGEGEDFTYSASGDLTELHFILHDFSTEAGDDTWAGDLLIGICDPNGNCIEYGGFNMSFGYTDVGDFPSNWNNVSASDLEVTVDVSSTGLSGDGDWTIELISGWTGGDNSNWDGDLTIVGVCTGGDHPGCYYYDREYTFVDDCGNSSTEMQRVWLTDTTPPVLISAEENRSVTCDAYGENQGGILITASDDCGNVNITFDDAPLSGGCVTPVGRFERTYTIADDCGNSISFTQFLLLTDEVAPELSIECPDDITIQSDSYCEHDRTPEATGGYPTHIATDNCEASDELYITKTYEDGPDVTTCEGEFSFTRTWTVFVLDHCYNHAVETCTQVITVEDNIAPAAPGIECPEDVTLNLDADCYVNTMPNVTGNASASTLDNCDDSPQLFVGYTDSPYDYSCESDSGNTFSVEASLGALESASATLEDDMTAVGLSINLDWSSAGCTEWPSDLTLEITSPNGQCLTISGFTDEDPNASCGAYNWPDSWNTTTAGNFVMNFDLEDELSGAGTWNLEVTENWLGACGVDFDLDATLIRRAEGSYSFTRTWSAYATDCAGNTSSTNSCEQTITVLDEINPTIDLTSPSVVSMACDLFDESSVYGVTASDNCDSNVKVEVLYNEDCDGDMEHGFSNDEVSGGCAGSYIRTYIATDDCGNSTTFEQVVNLIDEEAPVIALFCPGNITIEKDEDCFANDTRSGAGEATYEVTDNCSVDSVCVLVEDSEADFTCAHSYSFTRTWTVKAYDVCENEGLATCSQLITVVDNSAPDAPSIVEPADTTIYRDANCVSDAGPAANPALMLDSNDNCSADEDLTAAISFADDTLGSLECNHTIERTWTVTLTDECDNTSEATTYLQTIHVLDTIDPAIQLTPVHEIACEDYDSEGIYATASDNCDSEVSLVLEGVELLTSSLGASGCGDFQHTYTATDCSGNSETLSHIVRLLDTTAPAFEDFPADATAECGTSLHPEVLGSPNFSDNCSPDEQLTLTYADTTITEKDEDCRTIERTWTITDPCGNAHSEVQTIEVEDSDYPEITDHAEDMTVECDGEGNLVQFNLWLENHGGAAATDDCSPELIWDYEVPVVSAGINPMLSDGCGATGDVTVTFYATDACGNSSPTTATFTIEDNIAPEVASVEFPEDAELTQNASCNINTGVNITGVASASASDDDCCYAEVSISHEDGPQFCLCEQDDDYQILPELNLEGGNESDPVTYAQFEIEIDGDLSFDWLFNSTDVNGGLFEVAMYRNGDLYGVLSAEQLESEDSGTFEMPVYAGDSIGMAIVSDDITSGGSSVLISNFSGPSGEDFIGVYQEANWSVWHGYNGDVTFSHDGETLLIEGSDINYSCEGSYEFIRTWTVYAYDECGNESDHIIHEQTIIVNDETAPQFTETCDYANGQVIDVNCENGFGDLDIPAACNVEAEDNCDSDVTITCSVDTTGEYAPNGDVALYGMASTPESFLGNGQTCNDMDPHAMRLIGLPNGDEFYTLTAGGLAQVKTNGDIVLTAQLTSTTIPNAGWDVTLTLDPNEACGISHTGGVLQSCDPIGTLGLDQADLDAWQYFILNCNETTLEGFGPYSSGHLTLSHQPENGHYAFQLGLGANQQNANFGLSGWFYYSGSMYGTPNEVMGSGDFFFDMDFCLPWAIEHTCTATDDCGNESEFSYTFSMSGDVDGTDDDSDLSGQGTNGDHTPVVIGGAGDLTTGKTPIRVTNLQPNPTNDVSQLGFVVTENMRIRVDLIGMDGVLVAELYDGIAQTGVNHTLNVDADGLSDGMYQIRLSSNDYLVVKKLLVSE